MAIPTCDAEKGWPQDVRVAVVFQLVFEQWAGTHVEPGRHTAPQLPLQALRGGIRDLLSLSWQEYAGRAGFYRLMDTVNAAGVTASGLFNGFAVCKYPDVAREFADGGNELSAHGWSEDVHSARLTDDELREDIRKTRQVIIETTRYDPVGWSSARHQPGANTVSIVAAEGFTYCIGMSAEDRPLVIEAAGRKIVVFPPSFDVNDQLVYARGRHGPSTYVELFTRSLSTLLSEAQAAHPAILTAVFNASLYGHPFGAWALRECLRCAQSLSGVWITTHRACADYWLAHGT